MLLDSTVMKSSMVANDLAVKKFKVTVVTIAMNNSAGLDKTISSVIEQDYLDKQFVVIDGDSKDSTDKVVSRYEPFIDKVLIEPDDGIYHAMNKGIKLADGEWLIYMNSGDVFATKDTLSKVMECADATTDVIFSDWLYFNSDKLIKASKEKLNVRHQSVIYRKSLHETYGTYLVGKKVTISDYLFFLSISHLNWKYIKTPISICDEFGLSAKPSHFYQRILSEGIFGERATLSVAAILMLYPVYRFVKRKILRK